MDKHRAFWSLDVRALSSTRCFSSAFAVAPGWPQYTLPTSASTACQGEWRHNFCLPPHTTHEAQPLDCGVFGPLKAHWSHVCHAYLQQNSGRIITRFQFSSLFSQAWSAAVSPANIIAGFRTCGVYPFNPSAISATPHTEHEYDTGTSVATSTSSSCDDKVRQKSFRNEPKQQCDRTERDVVPPTSTALFTEEQERWFRIRFEEGFNVFMDDDYVRWLEIHHPESLPHSTPEDFTLAAHFSSVSPAAQVASVVTENIPPVSARIIKLQPWCNELSDSNDQDNSPSASCQTPAEVSPYMSRQTPAEVSPSTSCQTPAEVFPSHTPAEVSPSTSR